MSFTHTIASTWQNGAATVTANKSLTSDSEIQQDSTFATGTTDALVSVAFPFATLQSIFILSTTDITIKINSSSAPPVTLNIKANAPYIWQTGTYGTNPFGVDVTKMYLTNASGAACTVNIRVLYHGIP